MHCFDSNFVSGGSFENKTKRNLLFNEKNIQYDHPGVILSFSVSNLSFIRLQGRDGGRS